MANSVYDDFVHGVKPALNPRPATGEAVADIILFNHCDVSELKIEDIVDLAKEREPVRDLKTKLQELASQIPSMHDQAHLDERLKDCAAEALTEWTQHRPSFRGALKKFFGADLAKIARRINERLRFRSR